MDDAIAYALAAATPDETIALGTSRPARQAETDAFTQRELDVARLVVRGLSNRQIANELRIGAATVRVHVHHLLQKLGVRSRWQIAAPLAERGPLDPSAD